jgi:Flp pilus assembly protein TadG
MRRMKDDDAGAIAIIVALMMVVLLGMSTIVIDVGSLYAERRQLQNGADSAALAVAIDCARTTCNGTGSALATASQHANANANDGTATVTGVCGTAPGLTPCSQTPPAGRWDCPAQPSSGSLATAPYVLVRTQTRTGTSSLMPPIFAKALVPGYTGTTVKACARAGYGAPSSAQVIAATESLCEWNAATANGTKFAPSPPYPPNPAASFDRVIYLHTTTKAGSCKAGPSGSDLPGGFGFLDDPNGTCSTTVSTTGTYGDNTGASVSQPCKTALVAAQAGKYVVYMPIYNSVTGTGTNGVYTLKGFAAFVVTGYHLPGFSIASWLTGTVPCSGSDKCISGFFTQGLITGGGTVGGPSMGATVIQLTG